MVKIHDQENPTFIMRRSHKPLKIRPQIGLLPLPHK